MKKLAILDRGKCIAVLALLVMSATAAQAHNMAGMPPTTFPNNYAVSKSLSYEPHNGNAGTIHLYFQFTGAINQNPMCNTAAKHWPTVTVNLLVKGVGTASAFVQGSGNAPCSEMNQTLAVSFDLYSDQCTLDDITNGSCSLQVRETVDCTQAGTIVDFGWLNLPLETAIVRVIWNPTTHATQPYCTPRSSPPDYLGPAYVPVTWRDPSGQPPAGFQDWETLVTYFAGVFIYSRTTDGASGRNVGGTYPPVVPDCTNAAAGIFPPVFPY